MSVDNDVFWECGADVLEFGLLLEAHNALTLPSSPLCEALLQRAIVERAARLQDALKLALLIRRGLKRELEGLAHSRRAGTVLFQVCLFCLLARTTAINRTCSSI